MAPPAWGCWPSVVLETTRKPPSREVEVAQLPVSLQTGLDEGLSAPRDPADTSPLLFWGRFNSSFPSQQRPDAESQPAGRAGRAAAAEFGAVPDAGALQHLRGERGVPKNRGQRAVIPHQRGFPARGRVPELLLAVPTHRTWWQGPGIITIIFLSPQVTSKLLSPPVQRLDLELLCPWGAR